MTVEPAYPRPTSRLPVRLVLAAFMALVSGGLAVGETINRPPMRVACLSEGPKTVMPEGLCDLFAERVVAATGRTVVQATDGSDLTLVVLSAGTHDMTARIDRPGQVGEARAVARRDAQIDSTARAGLIDSLLALTPLP